MGEKKAPAGLEGPVLWPLRREGAETQTGHRHLIMTQQGGAGKGSSTLTPRGPAGTRGRELSPPGWRPEWVRRRGPGPGRAEQTGLSFQRGVFKESAWSVRLGYRSYDSQMGSRGEKKARFDTTGMKIFICGES